MAVHVARNPDDGWGVTISALDLSKFKQLYLTKKVWRDTELNTVIVITATFDNGGRAAMQQPMTMISECILPALAL